MSREYQCWPDPDGKHVWWRHCCAGEWKTWKLPWLEGGWKWNGDQVTPSVDCKVPGCGFHEVMRKTHESNPEAQP